MHVLASCIFCGHDERVGHRWCGNGAGEILEFGVTQERIRFELCWHGNSCCVAYNRTEKMIGTDGNYVCVSYSNLDRLVSGIDDTEI